jgi:hypothetical protein
MPLAEDQQQVGDLDPPGERKPFRVSQHETADSGSVRKVAAWLVSWIIRRWS